MKNIKPILIIFGIFSGAISVYFLFRSMRSKESNSRNEILAKAREAKEAKRLAEQKEIDKEVESLVNSN